MDFLVEFIRSLIWFVILGGVAVSGVFLGKHLREKKDAKSGKTAEK